MGTEFLRKQKIIYYAAGALLVLSAVFLFRSVRDNHSLKEELESTRSLAVGDKILVPADLTELNGSTINPTGNILYVFFDPNCGQCGEEAPIYQDLFDRNRQRLQIVGITKADDREVRNFANRYGLKYYFVRDSSEGLQRLFHITRIPYNILVKNGSVTIASSSYLSLSEEVWAIDSLVKSNAYGTF